MRRGHDVDVLRVEIVLMCPGRCEVVFDVVWCEGSGRDGRA